MSGGLFRKAALEKLSTPDQLDRLIVITGPRGWLALLAIAGALVTALLWGVFGTISYKVGGTGMLIKTGGLFNICHNFSGRLVDIRVRDGDLIKEGDVVARIDQIDTLKQIFDLREKIAELSSQRDKTLLYSSDSNKKNIEYIEDEAKKLNDTIKSSRENLALLNEKMANQKKLVEKGLITKDTALATKQQINGIEESIAAAYNQLKALDVKKVDTDKSRNDEIYTITVQLKDLNDNLNSLLKKYDDSAKIVSPYAGKVVQVVAVTGKALNAGEPVATLELTGKNIKDIEAIVYVPISEGKLVSVGMDIRISPTIVKKEEYGFILGKVTEVSEYPVTSARMLELLANDQLVSTISQGGAMIEVKADLINDKTTVSGYKWSTEKGPPLKIQSGTFCDTLVTYKTERPINLVIPILRKWTGIYY
ncbi:MAG: NHLP bacteriocin system secretion protein [Candidatus Wallbacteria bacterium GWC2_49_35]|uniref:NHLP bacteriocin system secretion protein n=1 Tax=Candidatus Wallbacteria bacterium GWC2_49_35 TaxID=1817813 RepID=A0A1F7WSP1_9BACT|nr:MAG: NHLP bacteriocin system secretion protein [Candidatus Wallbacteria bacterium GWC2_49_35]